MKVPFLIVFLFLTKHMQDALEDDKTTRRCLVQVKGQDRAGAEDPGEVVRKLMNVYNGERVLD